MSKAGTRIMSCLAGASWVGALILAVVALKSKGDIWPTIDADVYLGYALALAFLGLVLLALRKVVLAAELYIALMEDSYEPVTDKAFKPGAQPKE